MFRFRAEERPSFAREPTIKVEKRSRLDESSCREGKKGKVRLLEWKAARNGERRVIEHSDRKEQEKTGHQSSSSTTNQPDLRISQLKSSINHRSFEI